MIIKNQFVIVFVVFDCVIYTSLVTFFLKCISAGYSDSSCIFFSGDQFTSAPAFENVLWMVCIGYVHFKHWSTTHSFIHKCWSNTTLRWLYACVCVVDYYDVKHSTFIHKCGSHRYFGVCWFLFALSSWTIAEWVCFCWCDYLINWYGAVCVNTSRHINCI